MKPGWGDALAQTEERYAMGELDLFERRRWKYTVTARQFFWMLLHDRYGWSYPEIGRYMPGEFHHTTVLSGVRKARKREAKPDAAPSGVHEAVTNQEESHDETG